MISRFYADGSFEQKPDLINSIKFLNENVSASSLTEFFTNLSLSIAEKPDGQYMINGSWVGNYYYTAWAKKNGGNIFALIQTSYEIYRMSYEVGVFRNIYALNKTPI